MSEFSYPSRRTAKNFTSLLLTDFHLFCSFVSSHPLYFSYFIFFSPYLLKLLSFLSPLFITTFLIVLLVLFTVSPDFVSDSTSSTHPELSDSKVSFLLSAYQTIVEKLRSETDNEDQKSYCFEELEVYKIMFETSVPENTENPVEVLEVEAKEGSLASSEEQSDKFFDPEGFDGSLGQNSVEFSNSLRGFLNQKQELEDLCKKQEKEVKLISAESNKVEETSLVSGSNAVGNKIISEAKVNVNTVGDSPNSTKLGADLWSTNGDYCSSKVVENSETNLGSFGSMRKEKEWRRTLACKLFEERHNVDGSGVGGEGMDMLWETYEATDSTKVKTNKKKTTSTTKGRSIKECYEDDEEEEEEGYDDGDEQLCCLQALKFSAGKMNLGMGRPNLVKISKAFKGIGWLHHVTKIRKKGYH